MLVLRWNERSRRTAERHGFGVARKHGDFDVLERAAAS
jgi:hypothetical protein